MTQNYELMIKEIKDNLSLSGIKAHEISPTNVSQRIFRQNSNFKQFLSEISYFPLEWFFSYESEDLAVELKFLDTSNEGLHLKFGKNSLSFKFIMIFYARDSTINFFSKSHF